MTCIQTNPPAGKQPLKVVGKIDAPGTRIEWTNEAGQTCTYARTERLTVNEGPSLIGSWTALLSDGSQHLAFLHADQTLTTDFGFTARWEQIWLRILGIETSPPPGKEPVKLEGKIDPTGDRIVWTNQRGETCSYARRRQSETSPGTRSRCNTPSWKSCASVESNMTSGNRR